MNVHRLAALSTTAVIAAACSSGGSSPAPHAAPTAGNAAPSLAKHAPNTKLTLKFSNIVHVNSVHRNGSKLTATAKRKPKFLDPNTYDQDFIEIAVTNSSNNAPTTNYMAVTDLAVSPGADGTQTIPIYLAPGEDTVLVQEVGEYFDGGYLLSNGYSGYLLSQGNAMDQNHSSVISVSEGSSQQLSVEMQLVLGSMYSTSNSNAPNGVAQESGLAILTSISSYYFATGYFSPSSSAQFSSVCVYNGASLYFLPTDDAGDTDAFSSSSGAGNVAPGIGIPVATYAANPSGSSTAISNPFGGYNINFDSNGDPITITATFASVVVDPSIYSPNGLYGIGYQGPGYVPAYSPFNGGTYITEVPSTSAVYTAVIYNQSDPSHCQQEE